MQNFYLLVSLVCLGLLAGIIILLRRNDLREKYVILWLFITLGMAIVFFDETIVTRISELLGIKYPPTTVFIAAILGLLMLNLMLSVIDSHQTNRIIKLSQTVALLEEKVKKLIKEKEKKQ